MGSGRSGSTILGVTLGNCQGMFFVGELDRWLPADGVPVLGGSERTRFWSAVRSRMEVDEGLLGPRTRDAFERALGVLRPGVLRRRLTLRGRYRAATGRLYRVIAEEAGASHVVDSSHFPLRARQLQAIEEIDLYLVFLVRHPQSVIASFTDVINRDDAIARLRRILAVNANLWATYLLSTRVFLRQPRERRLFVRYEEFTADPPAVLRRVLDMAGSDAAIPDLTELRTGCPMSGNRLLRNETVALRPETPRPAETEPITALLQAPLAPVFARLRPAVSVPAGPAGG